VDERSDFKFGVEVDLSMSQTMDDKLSLKVVLSCHVNHLRFYAPKTSLEWLKLQSSYFIQWLT